MNKLRSALVDLCEHGVVIVDGEELAKQVQKSHPKTTTATLIGKDRWRIEEIK